MAGQERDPRAYELMAIFVPDLADEDSQPQLDRVSGYITSAGGAVKEVLTGSPWGRRRLAYTIRFNNVDYRDGIYSVYHFDAAPSAITELERDLKLDTSTMRYLLVHDDPKTHERVNPEDAEAAGQAEQEAKAEAVASATTRAAGSVVAPDETLTDDAVSAEDQPITEAAPEQLDPESAQAPVSRVVTSEGESETASTDDEAVAESTSDEAGTEMANDDAESAGDEAKTESAGGVPGTASTDDEAKKE